MAFFQNSWKLSSFRESLRRSITTAGRTHSFFTERAAIFITSVNLPENITVSWGSCQLAVREIDLTEMVTSRGQCSYLGMLSMLMMVEDPSNFLSFLGLRVCGKRCSATSSSCSCSGVLKADARSVCRAPSKTSSNTSSGIWGTGPVVHVSLRRKKAKPSGYVSY